MKKIENPRVTINSPHSDACAQFELDGYCYHIWLDPKTGKPNNTILHRNPPLGSDGKRSGEGRHFALDATNKTNAPLVAQLLAAIDLPAAYKEMQERTAAEQKEQERFRQQHANNHWLAEQAFEMLALLKMVPGAGDWNARRDELLNEAERRGL